VRDFNPQPTFDPEGRTQTVDLFSPKNAVRKSFRNRMSLPQANDRLVMSVPHSPIIPVVSQRQAPLQFQNNETPDIDAYRPLRIEPSLFPSLDDRKPKEDKMYAKKFIEVE